MYLLLTNNDTPAGHVPLDEALAAGFIKVTL
jgi:hypothetical protein